jgi:hypothetical protein
VASAREEIEAILAGSRAEHRALLEAVSPGLRASLPVDATGVTQAIARLAELTGLRDEVAGELARGNATNAAVLHGRVFGRAPLSSDTVLAAFVDGARVRAEVLLRLAGAAGVSEEVGSLLEADPPPLDAAAPGALEALRATYAAHEQAAVRVAAALDYQL